MNTSSYQSLSENELLSESKMTKGKVTGTTKAITSATFTFLGDKAFLASLSNVKQSDFSYNDTYGYNHYTLTNSKIYDAEKDDYNSSMTRDDASCWAATAANMLAYTGWGAAGLQITQDNTTEDEIFKYFYSNFQYGDRYGGDSLYGIEWFFDGTYVPSDLVGWDQPVSGGNTLGISADPYTNSYELTSNTAASVMGEMATQLREGSGVGLSIYDSYDAGHAISCWGYTWDESLSSTDPKYYTGIFITDSDDDKNESSPSDTICYVPLVWDGSVYNLVDGYEDYYLGDICTLAQNPDSVNPTEPSTEPSKKISAGTSASLSKAGSGYEVHGVLNIKKGGKATSSTVEQYGRINISSGGKAIKTNVLYGGDIYVSKGGIASKTTLNNYAFQYVSSGGKCFSTTVKSGGFLYIYSGGVASNTIVSSGAYISLGSGASDYNTTLKANTSQYLSGAVSYNTHIKSGAVQDLFSGTHAYSTNISSGGSQYIGEYSESNNALISAGGLQYINGGTADSATIKKNGSQYLYSGNAKNTVISSGGTQIVYVFGKSYDTEVKKGGELYTSYGSATNINLSSGGKLTVYSGAIGNLNAVKGAKIYNSGYSFNLSNSNVLSGVTVSSYYSSATAYLDDFASLTLSGNVNMNKIAINGGQIAVYGQSNTAYSLNTMWDRNWHVDSLKSPNSKFMLTLKKDSTAWNGSQDIHVSKNQKIGTYKIVKGLNLNDTFMNTIVIDNKAVANTKINDKVTKNGVTYSSIYSSSTEELKLKISVAAGVIRKATGKNSKLVGTNNSDIFYGGSGNDRIQCKNGRDVVVYDSSSWGKDIISATSGTLSVLFNNIKKSEISQKQSGNNLLITKKNDKNQSITIKNYSEDTHELVFTDNMKTFSKYIAASNPTKKQVSSMQNEVWKKAGLASA